MRTVLFENARVFSGGMLKRFEPSGYVAVFSISLRLPHPRLFKHRLTCYLISLRRSAEQ